MLIVAEVVNVQSVSQSIFFFFSSAGTGTRPAVPPPGTRTGPGPRTAVPVISWILHSYIGSFSLYDFNTMKTQLRCKG